MKISYHVTGITILIALQTSRLYGGEQRQLNLTDLSRITILQQELEPQEPERLQ